MVIVLRSAETLPFLSASKITDEPRVEAGYASPGMPKRILSEVAPNRSQPFPELLKRVLRAVDAVQCLDPPIAKCVDVDGTKPVMSPTEGVPTPNGASQSTTIRLPNWGSSTAVGQQTESTGA
jgi:hypothetical protein